MSQLASSIEEAVKRPRQGSGEKLQEGWIVHHVEEEISNSVVFTCVSTCVPIQRLVRDQLLMSRSQASALLFLDSVFSPLLTTRNSVAPTLNATLFISM
eukprot:CAMPEP_0194044356 /NCGR_PEP_ID=MMETSP0009_2-20130614/15840_1 /TAXON_ID=210454 /ORGANISM="Grammatophora oceanica, Strain CCMP 410" /LENGTH=98 /DNA_ID=CAMNT_0038688855 /DNA_START=198 /DNA_END=491 /DNA_ORIENTATION=+